MILCIEEQVDSNKLSCRSNKDNHNKTIAMLKSKQVAHINCAKICSHPEII